MGLLQDIRHTIRMMIREKGFSAIAILALALGIGATSAIFSLVDAAILRPLPFKDSNRIMMVMEVTPGRIRNSVAALNFLDWRDQSKSFEPLAAFSSGSVILKTGDTPEQISSQAVSPSFFDVLGITPAMGRVIEQPDEDKAVISHDLWMRRFSGDMSIVGRSIILDDKPFTVVGVLPRSFILFGNDIWTSLILSPGKATRSEHFLRVMGRLKPGASRQAAQAEMDLIANRIAALSPETNRNWGASVMPLQEFLVGGDLKTTSLMLLAAVGFVLLISCVNVASLLLARRVARAREMMVRASIGAPRSRLVRQMLTESALLAAVGGALGAWLAWIAIDMTPSVLPPGTLQPAIRLQMDARILLFALAASVFTALIFGLVPAWRSANVSLAGGLRAGGRTATGARRSLSVLASVEIALAVVVLAGAGLLIRTLLHLENVDRGYRAQNVLSMHVSIPPARAAAFYQNVERELNGVPGVRAVGMVTDLPLEGWSYGTFFELVDGAREPNRQRTGAHVQVVNPQYFETLGIRLLKGRTFAPEDSTQSKPVCIINQAFAKQFLANHEPIGARINTHPVICEIVGVIGQVKVQAPGEPDALEIYMPITQSPPPASAIALRTDVDPLTLVKAAAAAIHRVDPDVPVTQIGTLEEIAASSVNRPRLRASLAGLFAAIGALLACVGIFGVLSYSVSQRMREIGVRMALGARASDVFALVLGEGSRIAAAGIAAGLVIAAILTRYLATMLFGVKAIDPLTFVAVPVLFTAVALTACAIPARRASRVDPMVTLRDE